MINEKEHICFVILHFGDISVTNRCIASIRNMECQDQISIIVVDNEVRKSSHERAQMKLCFETSGQVTVLQNTGKGGFSQANNLGYAYAREVCGADYIVIVNNDTVFTQRDFVNRMLDESRKHSCAVLGPYIKKKRTGEPQNPLDLRLRTEEEAQYTIKMNRFFLRGFSILFPLLLLYEQVTALKRKRVKLHHMQDYRSEQENVVLFGAAYIFTPIFVKAETVAFWPETEFYYEEYLLALRCRRRNYKMVYTPTLHVVHETGTATKNRYKDKKRKMQFLLEHTADSCETYLHELRRV